MSEALCLERRPVLPLALDNGTVPALAYRYPEQWAIVQTYENIEIIVCDDSSLPEMEEIARRLGRIRPLRYERNPTRLKGRGNYKKCYALATGEFIKYLNDGDIL